jgi:hypothetical protein
LPVAATSALWKATSAAWKCSSTAVPAGRAAGLLHSSERLRQEPDVARARSLRRHARRLDLKDAATFHVLGQHVAAAAALKRGGEDVGIKDVPRAGLVDGRALPVPDGDQAAFLQRADRLARDSAADLKLGGQTSFCRTEASAQFPPPAHPPTPR